MNTDKQKTMGWLLIFSAIALLIPYTILTIIFQYPDVLREDPSIILTRFHDGGPGLIWTWFAFGIAGIPLIPAYILMGRQFDSASSLVKIATNIGLVSLIVQMIGLLRWTFVIPVLADTYVHATDDATRSAAVVAFKTIHQFGGVLLGEHIGQLFTIAWTIMMTVVFAKLKLFPKWINVLGIGSALIYLMAQAELFATVMPGFPVWDMAGFIGSTLWLVWLIVIGVRFIKTKK